MKKRVAKFIVSCIACVSLAVGFSVTASADVIGGAGLLGSALGSLNIDLLAGGAATMATLAPWLNGDFSIIGALTGVADGYVKVGDSTVTIDGVEYESIFLDPQMAAELHTQAFDFKTQKAITDNSSGILATGAGHYDGIPIYSVSGGLMSQAVYVTAPGTYTYGNFTYEVLNTTSSQQPLVYYSGSQLSPNSSYQRYPAYAFIRCSSTNCYFKWASDPTPRSAGVTYSAPQNYVSQAFDYSYVSGIIDPTPLPANYGFQLFAPTQTLAQSGFSAGTIYIDGGAGTDSIIDLIHLLDDIYGQQQIKDAEFTAEVVPPQPIDTPLGEIPYQDFLDTFGQSVYGKLDSISDGIDTVGQVISGQGTDIIEAVDTAGQSVVEELEVIGGAIDTAGQSVVDSVEESTGILEEAIEAVEAKVDELVDSIAEVVEEIMTHPLDLFSAWLDRLPEIPAIKDIFDGIKRHVGIWHYVVEWLGCIGSFLAFFIGLFGDVAYCMVVPIYACVAGAICLAFYKRFAR